MRARSTYGSRATMGEPLSRIISRALAIVLCGACSGADQSARDEQWIVPLTSGLPPAAARDVCESEAGEDVGRWELDQDWRSGVAVAAQGWRWEGSLPDEPWQLELSLGAIEAAVVSLEVSTATHSAKERVALEPNRWSEVRLKLPDGGDTVVSVRPSESRCPVVVGAPVAVRALASTSRPNVLLVSVDTLRADRLSSYGYSRPTSLKLDAWASQKAVRFDQAVTQSPWTLPAHASMLTGMMPWRHGANWNDPQETLPDEIPTMAELLGQAGYRTIAITGGGFVHPRYGFARGFESYRFWGGENPALELEDGLKRALATVGDSSLRPLFLFFHTYETHMPHQWREVAELRGFERSGLQDVAVLAEPGRPRPETGFLGAHRWWIRRSDGSELEGHDAAVLINRFYDSAVVLVDEALGRLLPAFSSAGPGLVVVTSDHGESLGEGGVWSHTNLTEANLRVPLFVAFPDGRGAGKVVDHQVEVVDILPTVAREIGVSAKPLDGLPLELDAPARQRAAVSWSATNNQGFALRLEGGDKLIFRDSVWQSPVPRARIAQWRSDPHDLEWKPLGNAALSREPLRDLSRRVIREGMGTFLQVRNRGARPWDLTVSSSLIDPVSVKSFDLPEGRARWEGMGRLGLEAPAGTEATLWLARAGAEGVDISVTLAIASCPAPLDFTVALDAARYAAPAGYDVSEQYCGVSEGRRGVAGSGITVVHRRGSAKAVDVDRSGEHRRQLEALGYL